MKKLQDPKKDKKTKKIDLNLEDLDINAETQNIIEIDELPGEAPKNRLVLEKEDLALKTQASPGTGSSYSRQTVPHNNMTNDVRGRGKSLLSRSPVPEQNKFRIASIAAVVLLLLATATLAAYFTSSLPFASSKTIKDNQSLAFHTASGLEYESPTGLHVKVRGIAEDSEASFILDASLFSEPTEQDLVEVYGIFDLSISTEEPLAEHPEVELSFTIPAELDSTDTLILFEGSQGYGLPGGAVQVSDQTIQLLVPELSRFVMVVPRNRADINPLIRKPTESMITDQGDLEVIVKLAAVESLVFGFGGSPWFSLETSSGVNQHSVVTPNDYLFNYITPRRSYLGPDENKDLIFTFSGVGGESYLSLSASSWDAIVITWIDALYRLATGSPLPWPINEDLLNQDEELAALMGLLEHLLTDTQGQGYWAGGNAMTRAHNLLLYLWEQTRDWALEQGEDYIAHQVGDLWWKFARTSNLFVGQIIYALAGESEQRLDFYVRTPSPELRVSPQSATINAGESVQFAASLETPGGESLSFPAARWITTGGGEINDEGLFISNEEASGKYDITFRVAVYGDDGLIETLTEGATVIIGTESPEPEPEHSADRNPLVFFGRSMDEIKSLFGEPNRRETFEGSEFFEYQDMGITFFFFDPYHGLVPDAVVNAMSIKTPNYKVGGVAAGMTFKQINKALGNPEFEGFDEYAGTYLLITQYEDYQMIFYSQTPSGPTNTMYLARTY